MDRDGPISELLFKVSDPARLIEVRAEEIKVLVKENSDLRERLAKSESPSSPAIRIGEPTEPDILICRKQFSDGPIPQYPEMPTLFELPGPCHGMGR